MLFLKPPFHIIKGVTVFPDHERENVFHYAPAAPHITTVFDEAIGQDIPQIQLLKFRGEAGTGGFLNFSVDLGIDDERLTEVAGVLRRLHQLRERPIMSPITFEDGKVKLLMLGRASEDGEDAGSGDGDGDGDEEPRFVVRIDHHSKPSLYGDNRAIFSVELDSEGVQLVEKSLEGEMMPIGIIYSLHFFALRPAFRVKVTADWDRVQTHFEETFSATVLFSSVEIGETVDKLIEDQAILIEVDSFLPEGEDDASWIGRREEAVNDFKDMVLQTFFEPSVDPLRPANDGWEDDAKTASQVGLLIATGGFAGIASFGYKKIDMTRIDKKSINLTMNERVTMRRSIYPQAHLSGLFRLLRDADGTIDKSRFVKEVDLDDDWFKRRQVTAHALVNFEADNIESLNVSLNYGGRVETMRLTKDNPQATKSWNSIVENRVMSRPVDYDYSVSFRDVDVAERPGRIDAPPRATVRDEFEVAPQNERLYFIDTINIGAASFPWDQYPSVGIQLKYKDEVNGIDLNDSFRLDQNSPEITWRRFRMDPGKDSYKVRRVFHAADNQDRVLDWTDTDQEMLTIRNPVPAGRTVTVVPAVPWDLVSMVIVELKYIDQENNLFQQESMFFMNTDSDRTPKIFKVNLIDASKRFVKYSAKILLMDNRQIDVPLSETQESNILLRIDMKGHRVIEVRAPDEDFAAKGVSKIEAELSYEDIEFGISLRDKFTFDAPGQSRFFEFDYARADASAYRVTVTEFFTNGMSQTRDLGLSVENPLRLRLSG